MYLEKINGPEDVKKIKIDELPVLAQEIRDALLVRASKHGGHFGPNFGMVEATIALHYVFESPKDKIVYDVSHQSYPHKMLTGRKEAYLSEQHYDDVSGYTNPNESEHDFFTVGHTSTSVSLAAGLAKARDLKGENGNVIAVIGDGSLSGGEALEGLDFAAELQSNFIIIVNDNDMSIAENHGGLYQNLALLRKTDGQAECNLFKAMGLDYVYVDRGNDVAALIKAFKLAKEAAKLLKEEAGINATVINPYYITGLDEALLTKLKQNHDTVITLEDGILDGGFGEKIARFYGASNMKVMNYGLKKEFLDRYDVDAVLKENHLTAEQIVEDVLSIL